MTIDQYYSNIDKSNFYLGMISQVYRGNSSIQVENLSLLNHRKIKLETLIPNTINYFVVIDSIQGLFIGEIYQSRVNSSDSVHESMNNGRKDNVFPEISVDIVGLLSDNGKFKLAGFKTVGITDKVYIANEILIQKYLESIEINEYFLDEKEKKQQGKLDKMARIGNFDSKYLSLQPNTLFDRHLMAIGTTNSGKSTSALSVLDKLITQKKKILLIDPTGEYRDSFENGEVNTWTLGEDTTLSVGKVLMSQWERIFETNENTQGATLSKAIRSLRYQRKNKKSGALVKDNQLVSHIDTLMSSLTSEDVDFDLSELPAQIQAEAVQINKAGDKFTTNSFNINTNNWLLEKVQHVIENTTLEKFFVANTSVDLLKKIDDFLSNDTSIYIDASKIGTSDGVGAMIIDIISHYLINKKRDEIKPFVLYIDEVHRYTKSNNEYQSGLIAIGREGRKKGIFLFLTTQNPKDVPEVLLGQVGTLIIHRLTHSEELKAIQNQIKQNTLSQIQKLNQGEAILTSINLLQDIHVRFEKCKRKHENNTPVL